MGLGRWRYAMWRMRHCRTRPEAKWASIINHFPPQSISLEPDNPVRSAPTTCPDCEHAGECATTRLRVRDCNFFVSCVCDGHFVRERTVGAACSHFYRHSIFRVPTAQPAFSAADRRVGSQTTGGNAKLGDRRPPISQLPTDWEADGPTYFRPRSGT